jgi:hypothetical protein
MIKENSCFMISHLKHFFHDTMSYAFRRAKGAPAEVLSEMDLGKFTWHDQHVIVETRRTHTQKPMTWDEWIKRQNESRRAEARDTTDSYRSGNRV